MKKVQTYCKIIVFLIIALAASAKYDLFAQVLDPSFNPAISGNYGSAAIAAQRADGKFVITGNFNVIGGVHRNFIAAINSDETVDTTFDAGEFTTNVPQATVSIGQVEPQPDGKLIIKGSFTHINGVASKNFLRLNPDGSVDPSFNIGQGFNSSITVFRLLPNGKVLVGGYFTMYNGQSVPPVVRLNADGSLDQSFVPILNASPFIQNLIVQPDGKIVVAGDIFSIPTGQFQGIVRLNENGSIDNSFNPGTGPNNYGSTGNLVETG